MRPMPMWFARNGAVTIREQLVTQIMLGILSDELRAGERLPSTRELARRFRLHPNTVSAGYRQLERDGWLDLRRGSGVYVRASKPERAASPELVFDQMLMSVSRAARQAGLSLGDLRARVLRWLDVQPPDRFLLIEPDEWLARILAEEIRGAVHLPVETCDSAGLASTAGLDGAIALVLPTSAGAARQALGRARELLVLRIRSAPASLRDWLPAPRGALVAVASRWPGFLKHARAMLIAAGFQADGLLFRDARQRNWMRGLRETAAVVCDSLLAREMPKTVRAISFPLIADSSVHELSQYAQFLRAPLLNASPDSALAAANPSVVTPKKLS